MAADTSKDGSVSLSTTEKILARTQLMCPGYARVYLAWVNTPAEETEERKRRLGAVRNHLVVCGCAHEGKPSNEWIFVDDEEK